MRHFTLFELSLLGLGPVAYPARVGSTQCAAHTACYPSYSKVSLPSVIWFQTTGFFFEDQGGK